MKEELVSRNVVIRGALDTGCRMWAPILPAAPDSERKTNLSDAACASLPKSLSDSIDRGVCT